MTPTYENVSLSKRWYALRPYETAFVWVRFVKKQFKHYFSQNLLFRAFKLYNHQQLLFRLNREVMYNEAAFGGTRAL
jgi:hypothetical protein